MTDIFQPRFYRKWATAGRLESYTVREDETDLAVKASARLVDETRELVHRYRKDLLDYAKDHPRFLTSFRPLEVDAGAAEIVKLMAASAETYGVGPMAAVAGAIAELVGRDLLNLMSKQQEAPPEVIIENGGDCFIKTEQPVGVSVYAGPQSPFGDKLRLRVDTCGGPRGVCTSSGTLGHSVSLGKADAVVTLARSAALADAAATAIGNLVQEPEGIRGIIDAEKKRGQLLGLAIVMGKHLGAWGEIEIT